MPLTETEVKYGDCSYCGARCATLHRDPWCHQWVCCEPPRTCTNRGSSPSSSYRVIGSATLPRTTTFRNDSSYAAWYTMVECQPQTVEVLSNGYYVKWAFDGKVVGGNLDSRFGGVPFTGNQIDRELGRAEKHHQAPYAYSIHVGRSTYHGGVVLDIDPTLVG